MSWLKSLFWTLFQKKLVFYFFYLSRFILLTDVFSFFWNWSFSNRFVENWTFNSVYRRPAVADDAQASDRWLVGRSLRFFFIWTQLKQGRVGVVEQQTTDGRRRKQLIYPFVLCACVDLFAVLFLALEGYSDVRSLLSRQMVRSHFHNGRGSCCGLEFLFLSNGQGEHLVFHFWATSLLKTRNLGHTFQENSVGRIGGKFYLSKTSEKLLDTFQLMSGRFLR